MGEGLQRATAAAIATQLDTVERRSLKQIGAGTYAAQLSERRGDAIRQKLRRLGLIRFAREERRRGAWQATELGRMVLRLGDQHGG